ncbi:MAG: hypothetical protein A2Y12_11810 [Planctomycetes bacterium GWF2_42_9]|nr:MAG: hypothetical protein A2Y12_11810 [Planctomycetes bacterium GWF2_42_9]
MKKVLIGAVMILVWAAIPVNAVVIALETSESHAAGTPLWNGFGIGLTPDVGNSWITGYVQTGDAPVVSNSVAYQGTNSIYTRRLAGGLGQYAEIDSGVAIDVTKQYVVSSAYYRPDNGDTRHTGNIYFDAGPTNTSLGGLNTNASTNKINYMNQNGAWIDTGYLLSLNKWYILKMVLTIGVQDLSGNYAMTYDAFVTDTFSGVTTQLISNINVQSTKNLKPADIAYGFGALIGPGVAAAGSANSTYWDNVKLEVIPEPVTVCMLGLGMAGLLCRKKA